MSWIGWLFLLAGLGLLVVVVRGIVQFVFWIVDEFFIEPRELARLKGTLPQRHRNAEPPAVPDKRERREDRGEKTKKVMQAPIRRPGKVRRPSRFGKWLKCLKLAVAVKGYDYWVACALAEEDPAMKVEYLSKALKVNPAYLPAWGLKGNALLGLQRYGEAMECFDKALEMHPSALAWHRKGVCCYHLGRREEARECFRRALETCPKDDQPLAEEAARMKTLVEAELLST